MAFKVNDRVSVNGSTGKVLKVFKNGRVRVEFNDDTATTNFPDTEVSVVKAGRRSLIDSMSPAELKADINRLKKQLEQEADFRRCKALRRKLRARGHAGGLAGAESITVQSINN